MGTLIIIQKTNDIGTVVNINLIGDPKVRYGDSQKTWNINQEAVQKVDISIYPSNYLYV